MTRSVPLMMNVPLSVIKGISPKKTSSSLMSRIDLMLGIRILVVNRQANLDLQRHAVAHAALLTLLLIVLVLQADRLAAVRAQFRTHRVESAADVTESLARAQRIDLDLRARSSYRPRAGTRDLQGCRTCTASCRSDTRQNRASPFRGNQKSETPTGTPTAVPC